VKFAKRLYAGTVICKEIKYIVKRRILELES
jgi:hypothetical protein